MVLRQKEDIREMPPSYMLRHPFEAYRNRQDAKALFRKVVNDAQNQSTSGEHIFAFMSYKDAQGIAKKGHLGAIAGLSALLGKAREFLFEAAAGTPNFINAFRDTRSKTKSHLLEVQRIESELKEQSLEAELERQGLNPGRYDHEPIKKLRRSDA